MKFSALFFLAGLVSASLLRVQGSQEEKKTSPITAFPIQEGERMKKEIEGSWILTNYKDPDGPEFEDAVDGFATFHDGFLSMMMQLQAVQPHFFGAREYMFVQAATYRYRFDEKGDMQTSVVMGFSNIANDAGDLENMSTDEAYEYVVLLANGELQLRSQDQVVMTFRQVKAGEFPERAIRRLQKQRGGQPAWEQDNGKDD